MEKISQINKLIKLAKNKPRLFAIIIMVVIIFAVTNKPQSNIAVSSNNIRVIDGDTLILNGQKIRLKGIDAPELTQLCTSSANGKKEKARCGEIARQKLIELIGDNKVHCTNENKDKYNRQVSYCYIGDLNLNREMVRQGHAVACPKYDKNFIADELYAKEAKRGIWSGKFEKPEEWRNKLRNKKHQQPKRRKQHKQHK